MQMMMRRNIMVQTEEQIEEYLEYGGFWRRFIASIIDGLITTAAGFLFVSVFFQWVLSDSGSMSNAIDSMESLFSLIYGLLLPVLWSGFTVGKKALGIKIQQVTGDEVTFWTMIKRVIFGAIVYILSFGFLVFVSGFMVIFREDKRSIHDFIAGTHVIRAD
jgi:uncharacterized RDD family membrane protein YckC